MLHTGISWTHLPLELGFGSGVTCWRRLDEWQKAGVWERLHALLLARLRAAGEIEWSRAVADASHVQAKKGAPRRARARLIEPETAPSTTSSSTRRGIPLAWTLTGGNRNDSHPADPARRPRAAGTRQGRPAAPAADAPHHADGLRLRHGVRGREDQAHDEDLERGLGDERARLGLMRVGRRAAPMNQQQRKDAALKPEARRTMWVLK